MKSKRFLFLLLTLSLIMVTISCTSTSNLEKSTIGTQIEIEAKSKSEKFISSEILNLRKTIKKDKSLTPRKEMFEELKSNNYDLSELIESSLLDSLSKTANAVLKDKGYDIASEFSARYIIAGKISLTYGIEETGYLIDYEANLELIDNKNLPKDPERDSSLIQSHKEISNISNISTINHYAANTWRTNGTTRATTIEEALEQTINKIETQFISSFIDKLL